MTWEYMSETCAYTMMVKIMNQRGGEGWELINVHREPGRVEMLFKRPTPPRGDDGGQ